MQVVRVVSAKDLLFALLDLIDTRSESEKQQEKKLIDAIKNGPKTLRVVGRGTLMVDPEEIANSPSFKRDLERARKLVEQTRNNKG